MGVVPRLVAEVSARGEPKIGGSVAGFVVLVVSLILIIIAACTATFVLLRQEASEGGRRRRSVRPISYTYHPSSSSSRPWLASLQGIFTGAADAVRHKMKSRDGWVQAGDDDDDTPRNMANAHYVAYSPALDPAYIPSRSTVPPHQTDDYSRIPNRFLSSDSPPISAQPLPPIAVPKIPRSASPESIVSPGTFSVYQEKGKKQGSIDSDVSSRTFSGGSKFLERLE